MNVSLSAALAGWFEVRTTFVSRGAVDHALVEKSVLRFRGLWPLGLPPLNDWRISMSALRKSRICLSIPGCIPGLLRFRTPASVASIHGFKAARRHAWVTIMNKPTSISMATIVAATMREVVIFCTPYTRPFGNSDTKPEIHHLFHRCTIIEVYA
jgi:hypothetical protein